MFKIIFVLVINAYHGGMTTIDFSTLQQCETAREQVQATSRSGARIGTSLYCCCVPVHKTKHLTTC